MQNVCKNRTHRNLFPTTDITPAPAPIADITKDFPDTKAGCLDFSRVKRNHNETQVTIFISIKMPENEVQLQRNAFNFFKTHNLWMDSANIRKIQKQFCGFVQGAHLNLISLKALEVNINDKLGKVAMNGTVV